MRKATLTRIGQRFGSMLGSLRRAATLAVLLAAVFITGCTTMYPTRDWTGTKNYFGTDSANNLDGEYGRWLSMREHIAEPRGEAPEGLRGKKQLVKRLARKAHRLPTDLSASREWRTPAETAARGGVCLDKNLWLMNEMHKNGLRNVRLVLGIHHGERYNTQHAWLQWRAGGRTYLVDGSEGGGFVAQVGFMTSSYEPTKSFEGDRMWSHRQQADTLMQALARAK